MNLLKDITLFQCIYFLALGLTVYILTLKLKFKYEKVNIDNPKINGIYALITVFICILLIIFGGFYTLL